MTDFSPADARREPHVVGIGVSAGGLRALGELFAEVPTDSGTAFVVVAHLSPEHESHLAEVLQPQVAIAVEQVTEETPLAPDRVYIIPPNRNLSAIDTHLRLEPLEERRQDRAPIDHFFRTLARAHGGHAVGIVLTGTGSDGALGIRAIREEGGLTVVQDPDEAEFDGMPRSALSTGNVDLVLPLARILPAVSRFLDTEPRIQLDDEDTAEDERRRLQQVVAQLRARTGRDFSGYKRSTILRRIARRMQMRYIERLDDYLAHLREDPEEVRTLADDLLIVVTSFFRDPLLFEALEERVLPRLFNGKGPGDALRLWSVGCATGEEAYSLAILLLEQARSSGDAPRIQVFASDLHEASVARAREGFYPGAISADVSERLLKRYFQRTDGGYRVRKNVRELVVFTPHNVLSDAPFSKLDLIACRNLMIYLEREVQQDVVNLFHYALRPDGALVLGSSETLADSELFRAEDKKLGLYIKRNVPGPEPRLPVFPTAGQRPRTSWRPEHLPAEPPAYGALHARAVERYGPPSLLVGPEDKVVHLSENAGRYLVHPGGPLSSNVYKLLREELRIEMRSGLHLARERGEPRRSKPVALTLDGERRAVVLDVRPALGSDDDGFVLVMFDEQPGAGVPEQPPGRSSRDGDEVSTGYIAELEAELDMTRERLQIVIEEYETSQEEMRASNEELQSANEELRSTLEELETGKEELQSVNEELQTANQENRHKVEELAQLTADLQNLLASTEIATLFLDRELRVMRFTPKVSELFNVRQADCGRPISDLTRQIDYAELADDAADVLRRLSPIERELQDEAGRWYLTRMLPYRSADDRIEGVVITSVDITTRRRSEEALQTLNETLEEQVVQRTREVRDFASRLSIAEQEERRRLAQLLHDDLQQLLYGVEVKMKMVRDDLGQSDQPELQADVDKVRRWVAEAVIKTRQLTADLVPPVLSQPDFRLALEWLKRHMKELHDITVELEAPVRVTIDDEHLRALLFQFIRELLFNVKKHAGTDRASIRLETRDHQAIVEVVDGGQGFDVGVAHGRTRADGGFGLANMRKRLTLLGGQLEVRSSSGNGTVVVLRAPIRDDDEA